MRRRGRLTVGTAVLTLLAAWATAAPARERWTATSRWAAQRLPKPGPPQSIGSFSAGCLRGAEALPPEGPGFEVLHLSRHRYFGHPALVRFVERLALAAQRHQLPTLLIGDLGQARGGPTPTDHGSHQTGLDVDVSYVRPAFAQARPISRAERDQLVFPAVYDLATRSMTPLWNPTVTELLQLAASDSAVDRIFVNAGVKHRVCKERPGAPWLGKLRPWWGHHDHFHVRLKCPGGSPFCRSQPPVPSGDGCDELDWWFGEEARRALRTKRRVPSHAPPRMLPAQCRAVLG